MGDAYQPIDCAIHDYIEIACLKGYRLRLELVDGTQLIGVAESTETRPDKTEWLILVNEALRHTIRLDEIKAFTPLDDGAGFSRIELRR